MRVGLAPAMDGGFQPDEIQRFSCDSQLELDTYKVFRHRAVDCRDRNSKHFAGSLWYYTWTKEFMEAGKERLARDALRDATQQEVQQLKRENGELKQLVAELSLEGYRLKKRPCRYPTTTPVPEDERFGEDRGACQGGFLRSPKAEGAG